MVKKKDPMFPSKSKDQNPTVPEEDDSKATTMSPHESQQSSLSPVVSTEASISEDGNQSHKCIRISVITSTRSRLGDIKKRYGNPDRLKIPWVGLPKELSMLSVTVTAPCSPIPEKLSITLTLAGEAVVPKLMEHILEPLISVSCFIPSVSLLKQVHVSFFHFFQTYFSFFNFFNCSISRQMDLFALARMKEGQRAWYPNLYSSLVFQLTESIVKEFLRNWLSPWPSLLAGHSNQVTTTLCGLVIGLEQCFSHRGFYEQSLFSYPFISHSMVGLWNKMSPMEEDWPGITMEDTENLVSPWATHIDDEHFVSESIELLTNVVGDDPVTAKLLTFLVFFSVDSVGPTREGIQEVLGTEKRRIQQLLAQHLERQGRSPHKVIIVY